MSSKLAVVLTKGRLEEVKVQPVERRSVHASNGIELSMNCIDENGLIGVKVLVSDPFATPLSLRRREARCAHLHNGYGFLNIRKR